MTMSPARPPLCETTLTDPDVARCVAAGTSGARPGCTRRCSSGRPRACFTVARRVEQAAAQRRAVGTDLVEATADHVHERDPPGGGADTSAQRARRVPRRAGSRRARRCSRDVGHRGHAVDLVALGMERVQMRRPSRRRGTRRAHGCRTPLRVVDAPATATARGANSRVKSVRRAARREAGVPASRSTRRASSATAPRRRDQHRVALELVELVAEPGGETVGAGERQQRLRRNASRSSAGPPRNPSSAAAPGNSSTSVTRVVLAAAGTCAPRPGRAPR